MEGILVSGATMQTELAKVGLLGVDNKPGCAAKIFAHLAASQVVVVNDIIQVEISKDKANLSFTTGKSDLADAKKAIDEIKEDIRTGIPKLAIASPSFDRMGGMARHYFKFMSEINNSKKQIRLPIILAIAISAGILIGASVVDPKPVSSES